MRELEISCGVVINRAGCGDSKVEEYCLRENIPILLTIPLATDSARLYSSGVALVEGMLQWKKKFAELFDGVQEIAHERNRSLKR